VHLWDVRALVEVVAPQVEDVATSARTGGSAGHRCGGATADLSRRSGELVAATGVQRVIVAVVLEGAGNLSTVLPRATRGAVEVPDELAERQGGVRVREGRIDAVVGYAECGQEAARGHFALQLLEVFDGVALRQEVTAAL